MSKKIAIIGSAPSSVARAPYDDPTWNIWAVSPGAYPYCKRVDTFFEIHSKTLDPSVFSPEYIGFLATAPKRLFLLHPWPELPKGEIYPFDYMIRKWGFQHWSSSVSWMIALAIEEGATEIGLWGIDMAAKEEYVTQRPACQYWIEKCKELGIKVTLPIESDLNNPFPLYGLVEIEPFYVKMMCRKGEIMQRYTMLQQQKVQVDREITFLEGAMDSLSYDISMWAGEFVKQRYASETAIAVAARGEIGPPSIDWERALSAEPPTVEEVYHRTSVLDGEASLSDANWTDNLPVKPVPKKRRGRNGAKHESRP